MTAHSDCCGSMSCSRRGFLLAGASGLFVGNFMRRPLLAQDANTRQAFRGMCTEIQPFTPAQYEESRKNFEQYGRSTGARVSNLNVARGVLASSPRSIPSQVLSRPQQLALWRSKQWDKNRLPNEKILVSFRQSSGSLVQTVIDAANQWSRYCGIEFDYDRTGNNYRNAHIRVAFGPSGHWSHVGTDSANVGLVANGNPNGQGQIDSLNIDPGDVGGNFLGTALHEIGHALGAIHEHQQPNSHIPWNEPAVIDWYGRQPNNWTPDQVRDQVLTKYDHGQFNSSTYDSTSIMQYAIAAQLIIPRNRRGPNQDPSFPDSIPWNNVLSNTDKNFMSQGYGLTTPTTGGGNEEVTPTKQRGGSDPGVDTSNAELLEIGIDKAKPKTLARYDDFVAFNLEVKTNGGIHFIETIESPPIHMQLALYDSSNLQTPIATSTAGYRVLNARIKHELKAGTYFVKAWHRNRPGSGNFTIRVSRNEFAGK